MERPDNETTDDTLQPETTAENPKDQMSSMRNAQRNHQPHEAVHQGIQGHETRTPMMPNCG